MVVRLAVQLIADDIQVPIPSQVKRVGPEQTIIFDERLYDAIRAAPRYSLLLPVGDIDASVRVLFETVGNTLLAQVLDHATHRLIGNAGIRERGGLHTVQFAG